MGAAAMIFKPAFIFPGFLILFLALSCSENCVTCGTGELDGTWILHSSLVGTNSELLPNDTLVLKKDFTGTYRTVVGWGWYDFDYSFRNDSLFKQITEGQGAGMADTVGIEIHADTLYQIRIEESDVTVITLYTRK